MPRACTNACTVESLTALEVLAVDAISHLPIRPMALMLRVAKQLEGVTDGVR
jgi:hypothetical protein